MGRLATPFGEIEIIIDGRSVPYVALKGEKDEVLWPDVLGRYQITVKYTPDGERHSITCAIDCDRPFETDHEPGERLECQSFYSEDRHKLSIGLECDFGYTLEGTRLPGEYDYDVKYLKGGMAYVILPDTKTDLYRFGISWIDDVGADDPNENEGRDVQTWYGADPTLAL